MCDFMFYWGKELIKEVVFWNFFKNELMQKPPIVDLILILVCLITTQS